MEEAWIFISNVSSIVTLFLFILYIIGRIWNIAINIKYLYEKIEVTGVYTGDENIDFIYINGSEILKLESEEYLNWIKVYRVKHDDGKIVKRKMRPIKTILNVNRNEPIYFGFEIPEGMPNTMIEYQRADYIIGSFIVGYDGSGRGYTAKDYSFRNTLRTYLYYLVK